MKKSDIKLAIFLITVFIIVCTILFFVQKDKYDIKLKKIKIENESILTISEDEIKKMEQGLVDYMNDEGFVICNKIKFYNNNFSSDSRYIYALVIGNDKSLIEITNKDNGNFGYYYVGNNVNKEAKSPKTGVSYLQIIEPKEYEKNKNLENLRKEMEHALPDDDEIS